MLGDARQQVRCQIWQHADISMGCYLTQCRLGTTQVPEGHMVDVGMVMAGIRFYITTDQTKQTKSRSGRIRPHGRSDLGPDGCHLSAPGIIHGRIFRHIRPHWDRT